MSEADRLAVLAGIDEEELVRVCRDLVRFNTVNPPGNEAEAARYVGDFLGAAGFELQYLEHSAERATLVARLRGAQPSPQGHGDRGGLMFNGHLDVVPLGAQPWKHDPFGGLVSDGRLWGRGASDMKSGLAAMMVAAKALAGTGVLRGDLVVSATAGEEVDMLGAKVLAAWPDLDPLQAIIISEPTYNRVGLAERGVLHLRLATYGKTAHGSTPELGYNAITMMMTLLAELQRLDIEYTRHPVLGDFTRSINLIAGGVKVNVVPDRCVADVDMRTLPDQVHAGIVRQVEELIARLEQSIPHFRAEVSVAHSLPAVSVDQGDPVVRRFSKVIAGMGLQTEECTVRFATEGAIFVPQLHTPCIIFGPGDPDLAHQPDEHVEVAKMVEAAQVYALAAMDLLA